MVTRNSMRFQPAFIFNKEYWNCHVGVIKLKLQTCSFIPSKQIRQLKQTEWTNNFYANCTFCSYILMRIPPLPWPESQIKTGFVRRINAQPLYHFFSLFNRRTCGIFQKFLAKFRGSSWSSKKLFRKINHPILYIYSSFVLKLINCKRVIRVINRLNLTWTLISFVN